ncbi:hypothetical protein GWL_05970 [Herbaspirillum sp. GW103]|nr:hypothetical protein GWL_05970 [Herbaspirillum sp. GW103]
MGPVLCLYSIPYRTLHMIAYGNMIDARSAAFFVAASLS